MSCISSFFAPYVVRDVFANSSTITATTISPINSDKNKNEHSESNSNSNPGINPDNHRSFALEQVRLGATLHGLVHLPHQLAQPGKTGDILKQLLRGRGHYVALVSTMEDALAEQPKVRFI